MPKALKDAVAEPKGISGSPIPLFDRLIDNDPETVAEHPIKRFYNRLELVQSIEREVGRILNTRTTAKWDEYADLAEEGSNFGLPEMYGLADFSSFDAANRQDWGRIAEIVEQAILRYEPRITNGVVSIVAFDRKTQSLSMTVQADFAIREFKGEVTFPTQFTV